MSDTPLILFRDLPQLAITPDENTTIPVVLDNRLAGRVSWSMCIASCIKASATTPIAPSTTGEEQTIAADSTGIYAYRNGEWHKAPVYNSNWADLTEGTRFMLVNSPMTLTEQELNNVRATIDLHIATQSSPGLVRAMTQEEQDSAGGTPVTFNENGTLYVQHATGTAPGTVTVWDGTVGTVATVTYVDQQIAATLASEAIPIATSESIGGIIADNAEGIVTVTETGQVKIRSAYDPGTQEDNGEDGYGLVRLASAIERGAAGVPSAEAVHAFFMDWKGGAIAYASSSVAGLVQINTKGQWDEESSNIGPLYLMDDYGKLDVRPATDTVPGVLLCSETITTTVPPDCPYTLTATSAAIHAFVIEQIRNIDISAVVPLATTGTAGCVLPTGSIYITDAARGAINVRAASTVTSGIVQLASDINAANDLGVPLVGNVRSYVSTRLTPITNNITGILASIEDLELVTEDLQDQIDDLSAGGGGSPSSSVTSAIAELREQLHDQSMQINSVIIALNYNSSFIGELSAQVEPMETKVEQHDTQLTAINTSVTSLASTMTYLTGEVQTLQTTVATNTNNITALQSTVNWLTSQINTSSI